MITLDDIKHHCRIDVDDTTEDGLLTRYHSAAEMAVQNYLDRKIYATKADLLASSDETGIVINKAIEQAILLAIGHFYEHRESVSDAQVYDVPLAYWSLIQPMRNMGV